MINELPLRQFKFKADVENQWNKNNFHVLAYSTGRTDWLFFGKKINIQIKYNSPYEFDEFMPDTEISGELREEL